MISQQCGGRCLAILGVIWLLPSIIFSHQDSFEVCSTWVSTLVTTLVTTLVSLVCKPIAWTWTNMHYFVHWMYLCLLFNPLKFIYLHGPSLKGFGFWNGLELSDICTQLSKGVGSARFWRDHMDECEAQVDKEVLALCIFMWIILFSLACAGALLLSIFRYQQHTFLVSLQEIMHSKQGDFSIQQSKSLLH